MRYIFLKKKECLQNVFYFERSFKDNDYILTGTVKVNIMGHMTNIYRGTNRKKSKMTKKIQKHHLDTISRSPENRALSP